MIPLAPDAPLPLIPRDILQRHLVDELNDNRFQAGARLLQSLWRARRNLPPGDIVGPDGVVRVSGGRLQPAAARAGFSFLTADIAKTVRREVAYREIGALIEEGRLWENLLSSQALTFNLLARAKLDPAYGARLFATLLPSLFGAITTAFFEHSPGRGDPTYLGDHTAFDAFVPGTTPAGNPAFVAIEVKYSEPMRQPGRIATRRCLELLRTLGLHQDPDDPALLAEPLRQLTTEHLLASVIHERSGRDASSVFLVIAPAANRDVWIALRAYEARLVQPAAGVTFATVTLERVIEAIDLIGDAPLAALLHERYTDFSPVHALIDDWEPFAD